LVTLAMKIGVCRAIGALASAFAILAAPAHTNGSSPFVTEITRFLKGGSLLTKSETLRCNSCLGSTPRGRMGSHPVMHAAAGTAMITVADREVDAVHVSSLRWRGTVLMSAPARASDPGRLAYGEVVDDETNARGGPDYTFHGGALVPGMNPTAQLDRGAVDVNVDALRFANGPALQRLLDLVRKLGDLRSDRQRQLVADADHSHQRTDTRPA
jgi:hypothetical protein